MESDNDKTPGQITIDTLENLDFDIIQDMPWAQQLWDQIQDDTKKGFLNWCNIVRKLVGPKAEHVRDWSDQYRQAIDEICCDKVGNLVGLQSKTMDQIQELLARLEKASIELHKEMPQKIGDTELSLFEEQNRLKEQINEYESIINSRKKELDTLHDKQRRLCKHLGEEPKFTIQYPPLPTPAQLEDFREYTDELKMEILEREESYGALTCDIVDIVAELKYKPTSDFGRKVLSSDTIICTQENLTKIGIFLASLKEIKKSTEKEISQLREIIEDWWKILDVDLMDRAQLRSQYVGNSIATLEDLRTEVKRCEEIRKANIKICVDKLRVQLQDMWEKCYCTGSDRPSFKYFNSDCYTEDLLDLHEKEIQKWNKHYLKLRLLGKLEVHHKLWKKAIELENHEASPNRYKNRGGNLLQEEEKRNKLLISQFEEKIKALSEEYRNINNGVSFTTTDGKTPDEYIDDLHSQRKNARQLKLSSRKMQRDSTVMRHTRAKSPMSLLPSTSKAVTPTLKSATKRKIPATANAEDIKRLRKNTPITVPKPTDSPATVIPKITVAPATPTSPCQKRRSRSMERPKRIDNIRRRSRKSTSLDRNAAPDGENY